MKRIFNRRGSASLAMVLMMPLLLAFFLVVLEVCHAMSMCKLVETEVERCVLNATELTAQDDYRAEHVSTLSASEVEDLVEDYTDLRLGLTSDGTRFDANGTALYRLYNINVTVGSSANMSVTATLKVPLRYMRNLGAELTVPLKISAKQLRID